MALLTSALASSQTTLALPIKTQYNDQPAILISEAQMDSINLTYRRSKLMKTKNATLKLELQIAKNKIDSISLRSASQKDAINTVMEINKNLKEQAAVTAKKHNTELEFYKQKSKGKLLAYVIGALVGAAATSTVIALF